MVISLIKTGGVCALLLAALMSPFNVCAQLQVMPARNSVGIDETLRVEIKLLDGDASALDLTPLELDFEIVSQVQGSQVNIINGDMSKINTWSLRLLPRHSGALTIPRLCAGSSCSEPVGITVNATQSTGGDATLILEHGSLPERVFVGQQVLYKVRLLTRTTLQQAALSPPEPEGVECEVVKLGEDSRSEIYRDGWRYDVIERVYALVPQRSGTLHIPPVTLEAEVGDRMGRTFDPFGGRGQLVRRRSAAAEITVEPPARTEHPWLPAQALQVEDSWTHNPPQLRVGEPVTRTITVQACGTTAARLDEVEFVLPPEFRIYPEQAKRENILDLNSGLVAQLRQSVAIVPRKAGIFTLPALSFTWWDMRAQRWSTTAIEAQEINVLPAERAGQITQQRAAQGATPLDGGDSSGDAAEPQESAALSSEVAPHESEKNEAKQTATTFRWQLISVICAGGWFVTLLLWWRSATAVTSEPCHASRQKPTDVGTSARSIAKLEHELLQATQRCEPKEAHQLLQRWAACLYPDSAIPLNALVQQSSDAMVLALEELNVALYSEVENSWDGVALAQAVRSHARERKDREQEKSVRHNKNVELPLLYPQAEQNKTHHVS